MPDSIAKRALRELEQTTETDAYGVEYGLLSNAERSVVLVSIRPVDGAAPTTRMTAALAAWSKWAETLGLDDRVCGATISIQTWQDGSSNAVVALSFSGKPRVTGERRALRRHELVEHISTHLARVLDGLRVASAGLRVNVCTAQDITDLLRAAFDSSIAADVKAARAQPEGTGLTWAEAPPRPESTGEMYYSHDRVVSTSWAMATREDEDLPPLDFATALAPAPSILCKRATLIFRVAPRLEATLAPRGLVLTADVGSMEDLATARELPARQSLRTRLRLRAAVSTQDTTFLAGLPLDLATPHMVMVPREIKEAS
ncbi:hypothetical protein GCM10028787_31770 [Brachybacterium horti]